MRSASKTFKMLLKASKCAEELQEPLKASKSFEGFSEAGAWRLEAGGWRL